MRKLKRRHPRRLPSRLILIVACALMLIAAFAPRANAALIRYYDMEGPPTAPYPVNLESHSPALETGGFTVLDLRAPPLLAPTVQGPIYPAANTFVRPEIPFNLAGPPGTVSLGTNRNIQHPNFSVDIPFFSSTGIYDITNISFAYSARGNGYSMVQVYMSTNGGVTFTILPGITGLTPPTPGAQVILPAIALGTTLNIPNLVIRLNFTGAASNGENPQFDLDNIQIAGTIVPEPATVAGGLLGVLGLCWHQRRRLIRLRALPAHVRRVR